MPLCSAAYFNLSFYLFVIAIIFNKLSTISGGYKFIDAYI